MKGQPKINEIFPPFFPWTVLTFLAPGPGVALGTRAYVRLDALPAVEAGRPAQDPLAELSVVALLAAALLPVPIHAGAAVLTSTIL